MRQARNRKKAALTGDARKRPTNLSLNTGLLEQARALHINISRAAEQGLALQIAEARAKRWRDENKKTIEAWNDYMERQGLPLARYRQF